MSKLSIIEHHWFKPGKNIRLLERTNCFGFRKGRGGGGGGWFFCSKKIMVEKKINSLIDTVL